MHTSNDTKASRLVDRAKINIVPFDPRINGNNAQRPFLPGQVIVKFSGRATTKEINDFTRHYKARLLEQFDIPSASKESFNGELIRIKLADNMSVENALKEIAKDSRISYVVPNHVFQLPKEPNVAPNKPTNGSAGKQANYPNDFDNKLWGLEKIDAPTAWQIETGKKNEGPLIAVIDTGVDYNHPDLKANIYTNPNEIPGDGIDNDENGVIDDVHGYNAYADSGDPLDGHSHGTHCAGTIAAVGNNGQGIVGVNWNANILPVKIFSDSGSTTTDAIVRGIFYATKMGARITSNSWGGDTPTDAIRDAFSSSPALHILAAGNDGKNNDNTPTYPANYNLPNKVAVAATDSDDRLASFSNYGVQNVEVAAPGVNIYSTIPNARYGNKSGTSMATPHVSGVVGLIASQYPNITNEELKQRLMAGSDFVPTLDAKVQTNGRVNVANAIENDQIAPSAISDLNLTAVGASRINVAFTATGDDGDVGTASMYDVRFSDKPIVNSDASSNQINFDNATKVTAPKPGPAGTNEQFVIQTPIIEQTKPLYVAIKVKDSVGNASEISTQSIVMQAPNIVMSDDFDDETSAWTKEETWERIDVPERGKVWTDSPDGAYANKLEISLTSPVIALPESGGLMAFDSKFELENNYDKVFVEIRELATDKSDSTKFSTVKTFTGMSDWANQTIDLAQYAGKVIQVRFRLKTDSSQVRDGFYVDRFRIYDSSTASV